MPYPSPLAAARADAAPFPLDAPTDGRVFWITGLAGAGKSAVASGLYQRLQADGATAVLLDGDAFRQAIAPDLGFSRAERLESGRRNGRLCGLIVAQGIDVICATISMFRECHKWNRVHLPRYFEIYLRVPMEVLVARDQKGLYSGALAGDVANVTGLDLGVDEPLGADAVIDNDGNLSVA
jgi:adenylylsulfate kinase-like enzyme